jgi:DNA-directed RNA polymerase subunit RPC12/RpoP
MEELDKGGEIEYVCLFCGERIKRKVLERKIQCLKCGSRIFKKERDPARIKKVLAR